MRGRRSIHDARRFAAALRRMLVALLLLILHGSPAAPARQLAAQELNRQHSAQRTSPAAAPESINPFATTSSSRTPIRRTNEPAAATTEQRGAGSIWTTFITLGLILGGLYVALRVLKRVSPQASRTSQRAGLIDVIATRRLDSQSAVHVVRIGPRVIAVGASPAGLATLATLEDPTEIAAFTTAAPTAGSEGPLFTGSRPVRRSAAVENPSRRDPAAASLSEKLVRGGPHG